jgi:hypothetical protein
MLRWGGAGPRWVEPGFQPGIESPQSSAASTDRGTFCMPQTLVVNNARYAALPAALRSIASVCCQV